MRCVGRVLLFCILSGVMLSLLSTLLKPSFGDEGESVRGMYQQEKNSAQVVCFGASTLLRSFSPDYLFEHEGIYAYNNCSPNQPTMASYYLLKDTLELHPKSLSLIILDMAPLVRNDGKFDSFAWFERAAVNMRFSINKLAFMWDISRSYSDYNLLGHVLPVLSYHSRWDQLEEDDFKQVVDGRVDTSMHGQCLGGISFISNRSQGNAGKYTANKVESITNRLDYSEEELRAYQNELCAEYASQIIALCKESGVQVLLLKTPSSAWTDKDHDCLTSFAQEHEVDLLDMNIPEVWHQLGLSYDDDYRDSKHVNFLGSLKVTDYVGKYLTEHFASILKPIETASPFSDEDLNTFHNAIESASLRRCTDLKSYLAMINRQRLTVFVSTKGDVAQSIDLETKQLMEQLGMKKLASIGSNESYVGVLNRGQCVGEQTRKPHKTATINGTYEHGVVHLGNARMQKDAVFNNALDISSSAEEAVIKVNGKNRSVNMNGINFVVYDEEQEAVVDTSCFDATQAPNRISN